MLIATTDHSIVLGAVAQVIDDDTGPLKAWAEHHIRKDPDLRWVLGNYVEADNANDNGHIFPRADLLDAQGTLAGKPLNMMHREHYIVGAFAGAQLHTNDGAAIASSNTEPDQWGEHPYVEALAGVWHNRFQEEFYAIRKAHAEGSLYFSMEAIPETVSCPTCEHTSAFAGVRSDQYCEHMNGATAPKRLHHPTFNGGAIIIPPTRPGWQRADIKEISKLMTTEPAESVYAQIAEDTPHLDPGTWETLMAQVLAATLDARDVSTKEREKLAETKKAMPDGSYPIANISDLRNAIQAIGRAKNPGAVKAHIKRRARALGRPDLIPAGW